jgi:glyoxylase-like metal-dependent hydrolase (beta-lactamase superfamily II)
LKEKGFFPDDITDVFLTHLHFDHVGGAIRRNNEKLVPSFKNAIYWSNESHWNWAVHPNAREKASFLKENILPIQQSGQLQFINCSENEEWLSGIRIRYVNGHTEAMMLPLLNYKGQSVLFCADLFPSRAHLPLPWIMSYDVRPLDTLVEKEKMLQEAVADNWLLFFEHDPGIELCSLEQTDKGIRSAATFFVSDL